MQNQIKRVLKKSLDQFNALATTESLIRITQKNILLPFYHTIADARLPHISNLYQLRDTKQFIQDIDFFCKHYSHVSVNDLHEIVSTNKKLLKPVFHLTFDDGLKEIYTKVAPILEERQISATIFLNTSFIDNKDLFYRYKVSLIIEAVNSRSTGIWLKGIADILNTAVSNHIELRQKLLGLTYQDQNVINEIAHHLGISWVDFLQESQPYLNSKEIFDLLNRGFNIGSHSMDHPLFSSISFDEQKHQITQSFRFLEERFKIKHKYFSFPFNDNGVDSKLFNWLYNNENCKLSFGVSGLKNDYFKNHLHRIPIEGTVKPIDNIIKTEYLYYMAKAVVNKNTISRR